MDSLTRRRKVESSCSVNSSPCTSTKIRKTGGPDEESFVPALRGFRRVPADGAQKASVALQREFAFSSTSPALRGNPRSLDIFGTIKDIRTFAEYFNKSRAEFDMVDVGSAKENADAKMRKMLAQSIKQFQCKKIFFAGCHDAGYMHDWTEYGGDESTKARIILLETTPAHYSFHGMGYQIAQFDRIFRSHPLETTLKQVAPPTSSGVVQSVSQEATSVASQGAFPSNPPRRQSRLESESQTSSGNSGHSITSSNISPVTYATVGRACGHQNIPLVKNAGAPRTINCNAKGHQIDTPLKPFNNEQAANTYIKN